jgi:predicted transcriptional regulator of viral defense system
MPYRSSRSALERLRDVAVTQGGYVTSKQAARAGYGPSHLAYHVSAKNLERAGTGVYRLNLLPISEHDELIRLALWSRDRSDRPQAVVSHVSALVEHGLTRALPDVVHLSVPSGYRKVAPNGVRLHRAKLERAEVEQREGYSVTTALRALVDCAADDELPQEELERATAIALERGLVNRNALGQVVSERPELRRLMVALWRADGSS